MIRFRFYVVFISSLLISGPAVLADDAKDSKKEVAFGIDVARRGLWREARFRFEQATTLNPESAAAFNNLGVTLEQQGDFAGARSAYERALQLNPKSLSIQQNHDLFQEADEKRNKKLKKDAGQTPEKAPLPEAVPPADPAGPANDKTEKEG